MAHKGIRIVAVASFLLAGLWFGMLMWATFWSGTEREPVALKLVGKALSTGFLLIAVLATYASRILEQQADQIAQLERSVAELQSAASGARKAADAQ